MTVPGWGYIVPTQIYMLQLAAHLPFKGSAFEEYIGTDEERLLSMQSGRESLVRATGQDFEYDLRRWYDYLRHVGAGLDFGGDHVLSALEVAFGDPDRVRLARLLSDDSPVETSWLTSTVVALARGISADRAFDRLPILADALQDAGCEHPDFLTHCRGNHPHDQWCWVVNWLLDEVEPSTP